MKNGGGHFAPKLGGHFELESGGHFKLELGGQYHWNLHCAHKALKKNYKHSQTPDRSDIFSGRQRRFAICAHKVRKKNHNHSKILN